MEPKNKDIQQRKRKKKRKANWAKLIPVVVALVLIVLIVAIFYGQKIIERYSYSNEYADLNEYFLITDAEEVAIILQDEHIDAKARMINGVCYFSMDMIEDIFTQRFYINEVEQSISYTTDKDVISVPIDENNTQYFVSGTPIDLGYPIAVKQEEVIYLAVDYLKLFENFSFELFSEPNRMVLYTEWGTQETAVITMETQVRYKGGVKSEILKQMQVGDTVIVLEQMDEWCKVLTDDGLIGYVENKRIEAGEPFTQTPVTEVVPIQFPSISRDHVINMGFHQVFSESANSTYDNYVANAKGMNVIAPTWFRILDNEGTIESIASSSYVDKAHADGLEVWAVFTDVDYDVNLYTVFSSSQKRAEFIQQMISYATQYHFDGINIDFEKIDADTGKHFVQFLRELSIQTHANNLVLSVDNYAPTASTQHYDRAEQGLVADYVIVMGYDEHWGGGGVAGSVASINFVEQGIQNTLVDVPANKLINAIPFYTRLWKTENGEVTSEAIGMYTAQDWITSHNLQITWNSDTCQNYVEVQEGNALYQMWLEDEDSIQVKLNVMHTNQIAGVAEWKLGFEKPSVWDTIQAYVEME